MCFAHVLDFNVIVIFTRDINLSETIIYDVSDEKLFMKPYLWDIVDGARLYCLPGGKGKYWKTRSITKRLAFTFLFLH